jgi:hypothetical protein
MSNKALPAVPNKTLPRALYELLRRMSVGLSGASAALAAVGRGENPATGEPLADLSTCFLLPGRAGGQVAHGATEAAGTLTLGSTTSTTKGYVYLGVDHVCVYDEVNGRLGIGLG